MTEISQLYVCQRCPRKASVGRRIAGTAPDCPGRTILEAVGVAHDLQGELTEQDPTYSQIFCGREGSAIEEAIGELTTENRIISTAYTPEGDTLVTIARGPARILGRYYGPASRDTPRPAREAGSHASAGVAHSRPELRVISGGVSVGSVARTLDYALALLRDADMYGLSQDGIARVERLHDTVDGTSNEHAAAMLAAGEIVLRNLSLMSGAASDLNTQVITYKDLTGLT